MAKDQDQKQIARRYVAALFELAQAEKKLDRVAQEMEALARLLQESPAFAHLCAYPTLTTEQQRAGVEAVAKKAELSSLTSNFLKTLVKNRRLALLTVVAEAFAARMREHLGQTVAEVLTAAPLAKQQEAALGALLSRFSGKQAVLHTMVDPSILGGLRAQVGGKMIDASLAGSLGRLKDKLYRSIRQAA